MNYALIDLANTFFRARHVAARGATAEEKVASALHITLASVNQAVRRYGIDHTVFCLEGRSFRRDLYAPYKRNRVVDAMSITEEEKAESELFWGTYEKFCTYIREKTNVSVLRHERAEADDIIARFIHLHPEDYHWIISTDTDYDQLITEKVSRYSGVAGDLVTLGGFLKENGKPVIDKKTKQPKLLGDPQWILFKKCMRGDSSDNIFSAWPGVREKGTKNKVGLMEAYADRTQQGYKWNTVMLSRWVDHENVEHRVKDDYERNRQLIDLTAQPQEIKDAVDDCIRKGVRRTTTPSVGVHFLKLCNQYELVKLSEQAETYSRWLNNPYTGELHE